MRLGVLRVRRRDPTGETTTIGSETTGRGPGDGRGAREHGTGRVPWYPYGRQFVLYLPCVFSVDSGTSRRKFCVRFPGGRRSGRTRVLPTPV